MEPAEPGILGSHRGELTHNGRNYCRDLRRMQHGEGDSNGFDDQNDSPSGFGKPQNVKILEYV